MDGIINLLKPPGMTSSDAVTTLRKILNVKKVGHTGTLDPGVAGVLPICVGKATRVAEYLTAQEKLYLTEITLGVVTDTQDGYGQILSETPRAITREQFESVLPQFCGEIQQIPPMFSAVRKQGKHLYEYARQGIVVEREPRTVFINEIRLISWQDGAFPKATFSVRCSKGTYIRTLCHDIGQALGCGGYMSFLVRTSSGPFAIDQSWTFEEIEDHLRSGQTPFLLPIGPILDLPKVQLSEERVKAFQSGLSSRRYTVEPGDERRINEGCEVQVLYRDQLLGIGIIKNGMVYPNKVF